MEILVHQPQGMLRFTNEEEWKRFTQKHITVKAAGGLVLNGNGELLMMYRRGHWDLPKGKIDEGESDEAAALREVSEETGLHNIRIIKLLDTTYHTYIYGGENILKPSLWYLMESFGNEKLIPQVEEDITELKWVNKLEAERLLPDAYPSIREMLEKYFLPPGLEEKVTHLPHS